MTPCLVHTVMGAIVVDSNVGYTRIAEFLIHVYSIRKLYINIYTHSSTGRQHSLVESYIDDHEWVPASISLSEGFRI